MTRTLLPALILLMSSAQAPAETVPPPVPGGTIGTMIQGRYSCELPGIAGGPVGHAQPEYEFTIINSSSYKAGGVRGSYLLTGDRLVMTGGRLKGLTLHRLTPAFLRKLEDDGSDGELRCVLVSRNSA